MSGRYWKILEQRVLAQPVLSKEDELDLARRYKDGDKKAGDKLVEANLRILIKLTNRYKNYGVDQEDLLQEGVLGFMRGLKLFDPERGFRLATFAMHWTKTYILRYLSDNFSIVTETSIHVPRKLIKEMVEMNVVMNPLRVASRSGDLSLMEEVPPECDNLPTRTVTYTSIGLSQNETAYEKYVEQEFVQIMRRELNMLNTSKRSILYKYFYDEQSLASIGKEFGFTREWIRQLKEEGLQNVRSGLGRRERELVAEEAL